ncbi:hypothetical protein DBR40_07100 [Pedobacter sp. KBW01]|uniref:hypothetical protein n=1 Tax=Pedobacter sp. KBW01 TaxID=2153364 RepID=UPI000F593E50|nr:hypothetical protein [Pedobacter sp. KBW01]RQO77734.1 hypothetical protein DBR40_07100 [Pedobacter sp. KBW01]
MKRNFIWAGIFLGFVLAGCNSLTGKSVLEGTYVSHSDGKYSVADDTLVVEKGDGNLVLIHRRTGFRRLTDGKPGKKEYETEEWKAVWNAADGTLKELRKGRLLYLDRDSDGLILGRRVYRKVK